MDNLVDFGSCKLTNWTNPFFRLFNIINYDNVTVGQFHAILTV
jgi:hypothetical protein